ncbi:methyltransferase [Gemmatimonadota bacterium]
MILYEAASTKFTDATGIAHPCELMSHSTEPDVSRRSVMDIFADVFREQHDLLLNAVVRAAHQLGVFHLFSKKDPSEPYTAAEVASHLGIPRRRLERVLDVLAAERFLSRSTGRGPACFRLLSVPHRQGASAGDWDRIADVVSSDRPLELKPEWLEGHLAYVAEKGEVAAPRLWKELQPEPGGKLLDIGGGLGAYSSAYLNHHPRNSATLVDLSTVIGLFEKTAAASHPRLDTRTCDARVLPFEREYDVVLVANLLHLFGPDDCRRIVQSAANAATTCGTMVIKDVLIWPQRTGPLVGLYFALNMMLYTEAGDVHSIPKLSGWMRNAGLTTVDVVESSELAASAVVVGTRNRG